MLDDGPHKYAAIAPAEAGGGPPERGRMAGPDPATAGASQAHAHGTGEARPATGRRSRSVRPGPGAGRQVGVPPRTHLRPVRGGHHPHHRPARGRGCPQYREGLRGAGRLRHPHRRRRLGGGGHWRAGSGLASRPLDFGNSGTGVRLMMGAVAGQAVIAAFDGDASLRRRPMKRVLDPLAQMGVAVVSAAEGGRLPSPSRATLKRRPSPTRPRSRQRR